jgi:hypothetical protein
MENLEPAVFWVLQLGHQTIPAAILLPEPLITIC